MKNIFLIKISTEWLVRAIEKSLSRKRLPELPIVFHGVLPIGKGFLIQMLSLFPYSFEIFNYSPVLLLPPGRSKVISWPVPDGKPILGCCFTVISTGIYWLAASSCSWSPSTGGAGSLLRDAELPELSLSGTPGSTFLTRGFVSLGSAGAADPGFVPTAACGKRGCLQRQELNVRSQRESQSEIPAVP